MTHFNVSNVNISTLNITSNTYSLGDALGPVSVAVLNADGYGVPYLFNTGCHLVDGVQNCTVACQDPGLAFKALDTLHNCFMYPVIADLYSKGNLSKETAQLADSLGIGKEQWPLSSISSNITKTIGNCVDAYCSTLQYCSVAQQNQSFYEYFYYRPSLNQSGPFFFELYPDQGLSAIDLCEYFPVSVNQDIGGIGVYISYWIQTGIGLLAFLMVLWWKWVVCYLSRSVSNLSPTPKREAWAQRTRSKARTVRLAALTSALVGFHKAQCFFVLAINIAAQVDRAKGDLEPQSLQQLYNTWVLIKSISIGGYLPVTFTLFTLHLVDLVSWYLLSLTILTASVSIATLITIGNFNPSDADINSVRLASSTNGTTVCGGHIPGAWCYVPNSMNYYIDSDPSKGAYSMLGFCVFVLFLLMAKQFWADRHLLDIYRRKLRKNLSKGKHIDRWYSTARKGFIAAWEALRTVQQKFLEHQNIKHLRRSISYHLASWKPRWIQSEWFIKVMDTTSRDLRLRGLLTEDAIMRNSKSFGSTDWLKASQTAFIVLFYGTLLGVYVYFFIIYCQDLAWFASQGIVSKSWSFGQIVAITVWAEPLCEYIHLEIRGMKRGFQHRLLAPYTVVKGDADANESVSDEEGADKVRVGEGEELATLSTANLLPAQPYPSSATNSAYEPVRDPDLTGPPRLSESHDSTNSRYDRVERHEEFMPLEGNLREEDITWQMSDFSGPEREALSHV